MDFSQELSEVLALEKERIRSELRSCLNHLPAGVTQDYMDSLESDAEIPEKKGFFQRSVLTGYFKHMGFVQAIVSFESSVVFTFGAEIIPWTEFGAKTETELPGVVSVLSSQSAEDSRISVYGVIPPAIEKTAHLVLDTSLLPFVVNYMNNIPGGMERRPLNLWEPLEQRMTAYIDSALEQNESVVLSKLSFGNLNPYFEFLGEFKSFELMDKIEHDVHRTVEAGESVFRLSPLTYVILTPGDDMAIVQARFRSHVFYIDSLVLDFQLKQTTAREGYRTARIWKDIHLT